jgi:hypothetical protein
LHATDCGLMSILIQAEYSDGGKPVRSRECMMAVDVDRGQLIVSAEAKGGFCCKPKPLEPSNLQRCARTVCHTSLLIVPASVLMILAPASLPSCLAYYPGNGPLHAQHDSHFAMAIMCLVARYSTCASKTTHQSATCS